MEGPVVSYRIMPRGGVYVKPLPQKCVGACEGVASRSEGGQSVLRRSACFRDSYCLKVRHTASMGGCRDKVRPAHHENVTAVVSGSGRVGVAGDETRDVVASQQSRRCRGGSFVRGASIVRSCWPETGAEKGSQCDNGARRVVRSGLVWRSSWHVYKIPRALGCF